MHPAIALHIHGVDDPDGFVDAEHEMRDEYWARSEANSQSPKKQ
jgi:hypothetical protein